SRMLEGYLPPYDAHVVERLLAEGAVLIGKTNCDEFGMGSSTENSAFKPTRNPHDPTRVPGGSSGGSAAAVAAGVVPLALGTDTGGSIRQPASLCGVVGFKPTYGAVSRRGLVAFASSLDQIGPFGASVLDVAHLASALAGHDPHDSTSAAFEPPDYASLLSRSVDGLRLGVHEDCLEKIRDAGVKDRLRGAVRQLRDAGARIVRLDDLDFLTRVGIPTYYLVATAEASANLARFDGMRYGPREEAADLAGTYARTRGARFGEEVRRRILLGTFALRAGHKDAYYERACKVRRLVQRAFAAAFERVDLMIGGTSPLAAFPLGQNLSDPVTMYRCDALTVPASLAGLPAASVPCGRTAEGLPVGLQILGPPRADAEVLSCASAFEQLSGRFGDLAPLAAEAAADGGDA
ncbi:MAG: Asp-tRNA(Asn)/Glu-tRNA(Gln) amidotransferase subunit GatA, partial [Planctomycetota bacterium JB042]